MHPGFPAGFVRGGPSALERVELLPARVEPLDLGARGVERRDQRRHLGGARLVDRRIGERRLQRGDLRLGGDDRRLDAVELLLLLEGQLARGRWPARRRRRGRRDFRRRGRRLAVSAAAPAARARPTSRPRRSRRARRPRTRGCRSRPCRGTSDRARRPARSRGNSPARPRARRASRGRDRWSARRARAGCRRGAAAGPAARGCARRPRARRPACRRSDRRRASCARRCARAPAPSSSKTWSLPSATSSSTVLSSRSAARAWSRYAKRVLMPTTTSPSSGASSPRSVRTSVVLPAPLGPTMPMRSPGFIISVSPRNSQRPSGARARACRRP